MSIQAFEWVLNQLQVTGGEKVVFLVLAWRMNGSTGLCCPSIEQIALDAGLGQSSVRRHLKSLRRRGLIASSSRFGGVLGRRSNQYDFPTFQATAQIGRLVRTNRSNSNGQPLNSVRPTAQIGTHKGNNLNKPKADKSPCAKKSAGVASMGPADKAFANLYAENEGQSKDRTVTATEKMNHD